MYKCTTILLAAWTLVVPRPALAEVPAVPAHEFLNSIGVNSAVARRGENLADTIKAVDFVGLRWIRLGYENDLPVGDLVKLHKQTGVRFSYGLLSGGTNIARLLDGARELAAVGALLAIEGNNEPNNWGVTHRGEKGGGTLSWLPVAKLHRDLYQAVKADSVLKDYPVWTLSESGAETDNVGLQFLTIPEGAGCLMPDGTKFADFANCHNYIVHPSWPGVHDNQTWLAADPTRTCPVDGLYGNFGSTWRKQFAGYPESALKTLPRVTTETGTTIAGPITEQIQALWYLSLYLDQFKRGWSHTAIYLLRDRTDEAGNQTYGFYKPNYEPRLAATYLQNLTTILADKRSIPKPDTLGYSLPNQPETVHDLLLQKSDGTFELVVWGERFTGGSDSVNVHLGATCSLVKIYDPTIGTSPTRTLTNVNSITVTMSNHPAIIEIPASAPAAGGSTAPRASVKQLQLRVSLNHRYLTDQQDKPFFYLADTAWTLFRRLDRAETEEYLQNRAAKGFTVIQAYMLRGLNVTNRNGDLTLIDGDPTRPNEAWFKNVDYVINRANELGLVMGIVATKGDHVKQRQWPISEAVFNETNAFAFGQFLGNRYKTNAIIWYLGGDTVPAETRAVWIALARGLKAGSQGLHLVSYHGPGGEQNSSSSWFHNEDWLDFNAIQSGHRWFTPNYQFIAHDYALTPVKPTIDMEASYEDHAPDAKQPERRIGARQVRDKAYWNFLSGAAGHGYGCNDLYQFYDPAAPPAKSDYSFPFQHWAGTTHWRQAMDFPGAHDMGILRQLFEVRPWHQLVPDNSLIAAGQSEGEKHVQAAVADDASFALAYLPFGTPVSIRLDKFAGPEVKAHWFDPRNGRWKLVGRYRNKGIEEFVAPSQGEDDDWVLVLDSITPTSGCNSGRTN